MSLSDNRRPAPQAVAPWGIPATIAWLLAAFLVSAVVAAGVLSAWMADRGPPDLGTYNGAMIALGAMASVPAQIAVLALAARWRGWAPADYFALNVPRRGEVVFAALCVIAIDLVFDAWLYLAGRDLVPSFQAEAYRTAEDAGWLLWTTLAIVVVAPVGEEIAFRGFLFRGLVRPGREMLAIAAIALVWALLHVQYDWLGMIQIFAVGLVLGWFRWASGSTTVTIVMHVLINMEAMIETAIKLEWLS